MIINAYLFILAAGTSPGCGFDQVAPSPHPTSSCCLSSLITSGSTRCLKGLLASDSRWCIHVGRLGAPHPRPPPVDASLLMGTSTRVGLGTSVFSNMAISTGVRTGTSRLFHTHVLYWQLKEPCAPKRSPCPKCGLGLSCWNTEEIHTERRNEPCSRPEVLLYCRKEHISPWP